MALPWVSAAWQSNLETGFPPADRFYIDFRNRDFPAVADTLTYTAITSAANWSGYSNATGGFATYLFDMPTKLVVDLRAKAGFAYDTVSDQPLVSWYVGANTYLTILYQAASDKIIAKWKGSANERTLESSQYTAVAPTSSIERITLVFDSTTGTDAGSALYVNGVSQDAMWSGNVDALSVRLPKFEIRAENGTAGAWTVNSVRFFSGITATAAQVSNHFSAIDSEECFWYLNSCSLGHSRCNVTPFVQSAACHRAVSDPDTGSLIANHLELRLFSRFGEFADDQYAAFDPADNVYNGTSAQAYMRKRIPIYAETWYGNDFEPYFIGKVEGGFQRVTPIGGVSMVSVSAVDQTAEVANRRLRRGRFWEDKFLTSATEADSLVHLITRLATEREIYNYASNSSFENATIGNSWVESGGALTRQAGGLLGSFMGQLANASGSEQTVTQIVTFTGSKKINLGETWTFSIWLKSAAAASAHVQLQERDSGGTNGTSETVYSLAGGEEWVRYDVSRTLTDSASDRLAIVVEVPDTKTVQFDCAMLTQSSRAYEWFVLNDNDGASGTESADDADSDTYDSCGFDVGTVTIQHDWVRLETGENPWTSIKEIADACLAYRCGFSEAGVFTFKAILEDAFADPAPIDTLTVAQDIASTLVAQRANKIIVRGAKITEDPTEQMVWMASQCGSFQTSGGRLNSELVADSSSWPAEATWGTFVAKYDLSSQGKTIAFVPVTK
jgi:hypothetical protein